MTLIELMVVVAVVTILAAVAAPSFVSMIQINRVFAEINTLSGDMQFARSEAIKEGRTVTICPSANGTACAGSSTWAAGWLVFSDVKNDQKVDAGDTILRVRNAWSSTDTLAASSATVAVTFSSDGLALNLPGTITFTLHTAPVNSAASRCLALGITGRIQVQLPGTGACA